MQTNTEYMSEPARAERVVQRFLGLRLKSLRNENNKKSLDFVVNEIFSKEKLDPDQAWNMRYWEFACLVDKVGHSAAYDWPDHSRYNEQQFYFYCMAKTLLGISGTASHVEIAVRMFLALPITAFYHYLENLRMVNIGRLHNECYQIKSCCNFNKDFTIRDFLQEKINGCNAVWIPVLPIDEYQKGIMQAHKDIGRLLVDSLRLGFPLMFNDAVVCQRYKKDKNLYDNEPLEPFADELAKQIS